MDQKIRMIGDFSGAQIFAERPPEGRAKKSRYMRIDSNGFGDGKSHEVVVGNGDKRVTFIFCAKSMEGEFLSPDPAKGDTITFEPTENPRDKRIILNASGRFDVFELGNVAPV